MEWQRVFDTNCLLGHEVLSLQFHFISLQMESMLQIVSFNDFVLKYCLMQMESMLQIVSFNDFVLKYCLLGDNCLSKSLV